MMLRCLRFFRSKHRKKRILYCCTLLFLLYIFYGEVLVYFLNRGKWFRPMCTNKKECLKVLLVADPQIIGNHMEPFPTITPLTIYDSDSYLRKTFMHAYNFARPDIIIFLGDLMDEGSTATDDEFHEYFKRLYRIFLEEYRDRDDVKYIWLPGDNDIGGENFEIITPHKVDRFNRIFKQTDIIENGNYTFFKINRLLQTMPLLKQPREFYNTSRIFIGLSHVPIMFMPSIFADKVINKMAPHVLFTAHQHESMIIKMDAFLKQDRLIEPVTSKENKMYELTLGATDIYEILVPTCSYRMGTSKIGYGYAVLEKNELKYTVLWSPGRFERLGSYIITFPLYVLICFLLWLL